MNEFIFQRFDGEWISDHRRGEKKKRITIKFVNTRIFLKLNNLQDYNSSYSLKKKINLNYSITSLVA